MGEMIKIIVDTTTVDDTNWDAELIKLEDKHQLARWAYNRGEWLRYTVQRLKILSEIRDMACPWCEIK